MSEHRVFGLAIVLLGIAGLAYWLLALTDWPNSFNEMMQGVGVEIIGAFVTALGVIGIERLYAKPDPQIDLLNKQVEQQNHQIALLQKQLHMIQLQNKAKTHRSRKPKGN